MKKIALALVLCLVVLAIGLGIAGTWYVRTKLPQREGALALPGLRAPVTVQYDDRGVPHIQAANEADLYRALGYVHAQDRLFQMEVMRRLAEGELSEIFGPALIESDRLFRTLGLRVHAQQRVAQLDPASPATQALQAYLEGINTYQNSRPAPMEFDLLGIPRRPFTAADTLAVSGYLAYSFATALRTEPVMTYIRDQLGPHYLDVFGLEAPAGATAPTGSTPPPNPAALALGPSDWKALQRLGAASLQVAQDTGVGAFMGSNAWVISGKRSASGKPQLAGDPHIGFSVPAVWYEAQLTAPGFDLYGHFQALNPMALLGHNARFGWSLTMFQNDDMDLVAEKVNPANAQQVSHQDKWVELTVRQESIRVKGQPPVALELRQSPHGPIITDAFKDSLGGRPIALWWAFLTTENPLLEAFYQLNRAATRAQAREAASRIHAPGLNIVWANAEGDIAWWAAAQLPQRPPGVQGAFILDAARGEAEKPGYYHFNFNPQEENPARGYIVSANQQPRAGMDVPGYYLLPDRAERLDSTLQASSPRWTVERSAQLQLDVCNGYPNRLLEKLLPLLQSQLTDANDRAFLEPLQKWDGCYDRNSVAATLFSQFSYELAQAAFADELGPALFQNLLDSPALDHALVALAGTLDSPWWDNKNTPRKENPYDTLRLAWSQTLAHLQGLYGSSLLDWSWGHTHTLTHRHPLGYSGPLDKVFNVGPFSVTGGRETPNNLSGPVGPAPWAVRYGPSTRRIIDFGAPDQAWGINPVGQSGVLFDAHYADQAERFVAGRYGRQRIVPSDILAHSTERLLLQPAR